MVVFPHCKINLGLHILAKRDDGYHSISTCFYPVPWTDILEVIESDSLDFQITGNHIPGAQSDNLCLKAYALVNQKVGLPPVRIHLHKIIPTGAGLGGGSSDAAFTLRVLNTKFDLGLSFEELRVMASQLGSDCAYFLQDAPLRATERGHVLHPVNVSLLGKYLVIVKPDIHVSTAEAYAGVQPGIPDTNLQDIVSGDFAHWKLNLKNDFERSIFEKHPTIRSVKERLYSQGAAYASMSGSGSSVFGIFDGEVDLQAEFPGMTYWGGQLSF